MSILQSIILGIIQGLTEFFPISSSGHLVIFPYLFNWDYLPLYFTVTVHFGTLLAVVLVFYKDIFNILKSFFLALFKRNQDHASLKLGWFLILGSIPAAIAGFFLEDYADRLFSNPVMVAFLLLLTAALLFGSEYYAKKQVEKQSKDVYVHDELASSLTWKKSLIIGLGQAIAIMPGVSRSGATISFGRFLSLSRKQSVRFSFLLSVPVIFGSFLFQVLKVRQAIFDGGSTIALNLGIGFICSFLSGLFAIKFMLRLVENKNLNGFAVYCVLLSILIIILNFIKL
ncbi:MAG: undecaprenyl-diphosphatase UppP [Actinomycetota bacterium]|nr:undecaprenyl-diphosphatase UppP [Actinomycetota bacterium]